MKIVFMGTPDFAVPVLQSLVEEGHDIIRVVTQPDRPKGRKRERVKTPVKVEAEKHGIEVFQPEKVREEAAVKHAVSGDPDLIVTAAYGQLLPESLLEAPVHGAINVHASLLPKYRGGAPIHQAIIDGESETGVTIMYMVKKLDAGAMLSQERIAIEPTDTVGTMHDKLSELGSKLLLHTVKQIETGTAKATEQDETKVSYAPNISRAAERIDWKNSAQAVYNQIRGMNPWPVAHTHWREEMVKCWEASIESSVYEGVPGEVVHVDRDTLIIRAGDGQGVKLRVVQPSGKKRMQVEDYLRGKGQDIRVGDCFDDK
ncbi:methionyl-tRNA formyltransferase [Geomicrobium sp. JSM 1781026]|uniref:methionyl-tRNA formyltransferase n=1 Tax=Geomicrobium sp. JSM 1781026 TaxID=3344580 RepID=UPI0035C205B3